jgi:hypothetical protein
LGVSAPAAGDVWGVNFIRMDQPGKVDHDRMQMSSWVKLPMGSDPTTLGRYGHLIFAPAGDEAAVEKGRKARLRPAPAPIRRERLRQAVEWLAAPEREGRGPGTPGIDAAAEWVAEQFAAIGVRPPANEAAAFQPFAMTLDAKLGPAAENEAEIVGPPGPDGQPVITRLELGRDFTPLAAGGSGAFDLPLAFAGYGITAPAEKYDDYAPLAAAPGGVKGRAAIVLRQEPQKEARGRRPGVLQRRRCKGRRPDGLHAGRRGHGEAHPAGASCPPLGRGRRGLPRARPRPGRDLKIDRRVARAGEQVARGLADPRPDRHRAGRNPGAERARRDAGPRCAGRGRSARDPCRRDGRARRPLRPHRLRGGQFG